MVSGLGEGGAERELLPLEPRLSILELRLLSREQRRRLIKRHPLFHKRLFSDPRSLLAPPVSGPLAARHVTPGVLRKGLLEESFLALQVANLVQREKPSINHIYENWFDLKRSNGMRVAIISLVKIVRRRKFHCRNVLNQTSFHISNLKERFSPLLVAPKITFRMPNVDDVGTNQSIFENI